MIVLLLLSLFSLLQESDESDCKIIKNAYNRVVKLIYEETCLISALKAKYLASVEVSDLNL